jgi:hypothetical protein
MLMRGDLDGPSFVRPRRRLDLLQEGDIRIESREVVPRALVTGLE